MKALVTGGGKRGRALGNARGKKRLQLSRNKKDKSQAE